MAIQAGLVGLPNVGKSTLFNALTNSQIPAENYPFCTIDPHMAITEVPDERLVKLSQIFNSEKLIPATVQFVDIAGLVKGAAQGEGLGNAFLSNVMGVDLILHVLRCFDDEDITHVHNKVDPLSDFDTICTELALKDLESLEKREQKIATLLKAHKTGPQEKKDLTAEQGLLSRIKPLLETGETGEIPGIIAEFKETHTAPLIPLLTSKNFLIIANMSEDDFASQNYKNNSHYKNLIEKFGAEKVIVVSAQIEAELAQMPEEEAQEMMDSLEITEKGLDSIITAAYSNLGLISFFTCGPKEAHAWPIRKNTKAPRAAGTIHSDLERGFICVDVYHCDDMIELGSESELKQNGKIRMEGKEYLIQDGDVINVKFNV